MAVQLSPNSVLMKSADVSPLDQLANQSSVQKIKELDRKAVVQAKSDTVTFSKEAVARSLDMEESKETSQDNETVEGTRATKNNKFNFITKADDSSKDGSSSSMDQLSISPESIAKAFFMKALSNALSSGNADTAYDKLRPV